MAYEFRTTHIVRFSETDMAGVVHFSSYFRYMETAEHDFLRSLGLSMHARVDGRVVSWPRVQVTCSYRAPLVFEEKLTVVLLVRKKTKKSITYDFLFYKENGELAAEGSITTVCAAFDDATGRMSATDIPPAIDEKIEAAPSHLLASRNLGE